MMLAVETATAACSVAVSDGNKTFFKNLITEVSKLDEAIKYFNLVRDNKVIKAVVKI